MVIVIEALRFQPGVFIDGVILFQPGEGGLAIVGSRRIGVLGRQPVVDAHDCETMLLGEHLVGRIRHLGAAENPAAAMEMKEERPGGSVRSEDAHGHVTGRAGPPRLCQTRNWLHGGPP